MDAMTAIEIAAQAAALRAQVIVFEAKRDVAQTLDRPREAKLFHELRAAALHALATIEDAPGVKRTFCAHEARRTRERMRMIHS